jgi:predicted XRE-type DNA-binding protein
MSKQDLATYTSIWDALESDAGEAGNMKLRSELMRSIAEQVRSRNWTQAAAARHCCLTQPRMNDLLRGRISRFSLDALVNIAAALGLQVSLDIRVA